MVTGDAERPAVSVLSAGLRLRCPRCGRGRLFRAFLNVVDRCDVCGLALKEHDSGDGPAVFVIFVVGAVVMGLALFVELRFSPPTWVHMALWIPFILGGSALLLRPFKAILIALQYRHKIGAYAEGP